MKCPFCGEEMRSGYLKSGHPYYWGPYKDLGVIGDDEVKLFRTSLKALFGGYVIPSDYCPACKKVITSVPEKE